MIRLAQVVAGIVVAMVGVASFGAALGLPGPRAAGKPASPAAGQDAESWIGKKAVIKWSAPLKEGDRVVGDNVFRVYTVERVDGDRVELAADGIVGWIQAEDVVLLDQAIDFYSKVIQGNEKHLAARVKRAQVREYLGDRARAIAELTEAIEIGPPNAVVHSVRGDMFRSEQQLDKAIADYTEAIRLIPSYAAYHFARGQCWAAKQDYDKAIADYDESIRLDPESGLSYLNWGLAWSQKEDRPKAIADYTEAIRLGPIDGRSRTSLAASAYNLRGRARQEMGEPDAAITDLNESIRLDPRNASAYHQPRSRLDRQAGVRQGHRRLHRGHPARSEERPGLLQSRRPLDARNRIATRPSPTTPRPSGSTRRTPCALHQSRPYLDGQGRYDKAIADYTEAIRLNPAGCRRVLPPRDRQVIEGRVRPGHRRLRSGDPARSRERRFYSREESPGSTSRIATRRSPTSTRRSGSIRRTSTIAIHRGWAWAKKKEYDKAFAAFDEVVRLEPKNPAGYGARAWLWASCLDAKYRDGKKAVESATKAFELSGGKDERA